MKKYIKKGLPLILTALITTPAFAYYDVTIGNTETAGVWNGNEWIPNGEGSTVAASAIQNKLALGPVSIGTGTEGDGGADVGDIHVNAAVSWDANTLTLTAANELNINAVMTAGGSAGLAVNVKAHLGSAPYINAGMGNGGFIGRVDFTGSGNTITLNGTPAIIITTLGEAGSYCNHNGLQGMADSSNTYVLGADIDATPTADWNGGAGFMPHGFTCGVGFNGMPPLDGLGHTINGLTINRPDKGSAGLAEATFKMAQNMGLTNVKIVGSAFVGALAGGSNAHTRMSNIYVTGSVTATGQSPDYLGHTGTTHVGGLIGAPAYQPGDVLITNVYADVNVTGNDDVGGLIGHLNSDVTLDGAYTTGTVNGRDNVGGLIGLADEGDNVITNVYSTATVNAENGNGMVGRVPATNTSSIHLTYFDGLMNIVSWWCDPLNADDSLVIPQPRAHYYNSETVHTCSTTALIVSELTTPLTAAQMKQQASYAGFDFDNTWVIYEGHTTPMLRKMDGLFDSDGDGYYNNEDAFPVDPAKWYDNPDAFDFMAQTGVARNSVIESNTITVNGISVATPISIASCANTGCEYKINADLWRSDAGMVNNDDIVQVRQASSSGYASETILALTIGDVTGSFSVTTDIAPVEDNATTDELTSRGGGGGCTINPQAGFDPVLILMIGASLLYLRRRKHKNGACNPAA